MNLKEAQTQGMLASQTISAQEVGGVKLADLPGLEVLEQPGDKVLLTTQLATKACLNSGLQRHVSVFSDHLSVSSSVENNTGKQEVNLKGHSTEIQNPYIPPFLPTVGHTDYPLPG